METPISGQDLFATFPLGRRGDPVSAHLDAHAWEARPVYEDNDLSHKTVGLKRKSRDRSQTSPGLRAN